MSNNIAQLDLAEPLQTDWENYGKSGYVPPPPAVGPDGNYIVYQGVVKNVTVEENYPDRDDDEGTITGTPKRPFLTLNLDPLLLTDAGNYEVRFTRVSTKPYTVIDRNTGKRIPKKGNPNRAADYVRACGSPAKPATNSDYLATAKASVNKKFPVTIEWEAYNKETGERISGYRNFPDDPERGGKRAILRAGDIIQIRDNSGNVTETKTVQSDVLFANARVRYFKDPTPKVSR